MVLSYPITRGILAKEVYKVRPQTLKSWLNQIGITHNKTLSPKELRLVITSYELPAGVSIRFPIQGETANAIEEDVPKLKVMLSDALVELHSLRQLIEGIGFSNLSVYLLDTEAQSTGILH